VDDRLALGVTGEDAALARYARLGYRLVARNWRCRIGELDLILERDGLLVFCEVKTRRGTRFGPGWEAVTGRKRAKIRAVAEAFVIDTHARPSAVRFDVASVTAGTASAEVELFEDAF
jgi:putative endonuclease